MNDHLDSEEIAEFTAGLSTSKDRHAQDCVICANEIAQLRGSLSLFREAIWDITEQQVKLQRPKQAMPNRPLALRWIFAGAGVLLFALLPIYWAFIDERHTPEVPTDDLLLQRVNENLSQPVPRSIQPLLNVSFEHISAGETNTGEEQ